MDESLKTLAAGVVAALFISPQSVLANTGVREAVSLIPRKDFATSTHISSPRLSPDGRHVAYMAITPGGSILRISRSECMPRCSDDSEVGLGAGTRPQMFFWTDSSSGLIVSHTPTAGGPVSVSMMRLESAETTTLISGGSSSPHFITSSSATSHALPQVIFRSKDGVLQRINFENGEVESIATINGITPVARVGSTDLQVGYRYSNRGQQEWFATNGTRTTKLTAFGLEDQLLRSQYVSSYDRRDAHVALFLESSETDVLALVEVDLGTGAKTVLAKNEADIRSVLLDGRTGKPDAYATEYLRPEWKALKPGLSLIFAALSKAGHGFPDVLDRGANGYWLVRFSGPGSLPGHFFFNVSTGELRSIESDSSPSARAFSDSEPFEVKTADGLALVGYFTPPFGKTCVGKEECALVVLIHGGPRARDRWAGATYHQLLANRGYAVMSVNYRGSRGFGKRFEAMGEGQWGAAMQEDVLDALRWVRSHKRIDEGRIAVMGSSHGGYLALNSVKTSQDTFRCAIGVAATANLVTFVEEVVKASPGYASDLHKSVGNPGIPAQRDVMLQRSPSQYSDRFKNVPLLLVHGAKDKMSPLRDVKEFSESVESLGGKVLLVEFSDEGHVFRKGNADENLTFLVEAFLADCLGGRKEERTTALMSVPVRIHGNLKPTWLQ